MLLLKTAGFSIATGLLFAFTARGFGTRAAVDDHPDRHRLLARRLAHLRRGLKLSLPAGPLERLIP